MPDYTPSDEMVATVARAIEDNIWRSDDPNAAAREAIEATQIGELVSAAEEFDDALGEDDEFPDDAPMRLSWGRTIVNMKLGDLRRLRSALRKIEGAQS